MKKIQILLFILVSGVALVAQTRKTKKADAYFDKLSYIDAAKAYEKLAKDSTSTTSYVLEKLGDSYYFNTKMKQAAKAYKRLFEQFEAEATPEYMFKYAQSLRAIGDYKTSQVWMKKFNAIKKNDSRGEEFVNQSDRLKELRTAKPDYQIKNLSTINSKNSDFGVAFYKDSIVFASSRERNRLIRRQYSWNKQPFLDLYISSFDAYENINKPERFDLKTSKKYHESSVAFSPDYQVMYFTRNNYVNKKYKKGEKGYTNLKMYRAERVGDEWKNITEVPFNSNDYSVGHPSVSADGKKLYFTSDMPGSIGGTDIYYASISQDGSIGNPVNLGPTINTEGREMFPNIAADNTLYFSSDGHFGLGLLDVFSTKFTNGKYTKPKNLRVPINSSKDDFAFVINSETKKGYFSSNRDGGLGDDDIYSVVENIQAVIDTCNSIQRGIVRNKETLAPLHKANVILYDQTNNAVQTVVTEADGKFDFKVKCDAPYKVEATKTSYSTAFAMIPASKKRTDVVLYLNLLKEFTHSPKGDVIIKINPIYFDFDKSNIRPDAAHELDKVVAVMNKYPSLKILGTSHTDSRGGDEYNQKLSTRRAKSTVAYIISKGISPDRISAKGYGETELVNKCSNGVKCSAAEHQLNRRTEFVVQFKR